MHEGKDIAYGSVCECLSKSMRLKESEEKIEQLSLKSTNSVIDLR